MSAALQLNTGGAMRDYRNMGIQRLRELARATHPGHELEATRAFVDRVLDMEAERVTWHMHENEGFQPFSPAATLGQQPGGGTAAAEPLAIAYERGSRVSAAHEFARAWLESARLRPRARLAVLIRAAKLHPMPTQQAAPWAESYDFIAKHLPIYSRMLQMGSLSVMGDIVPTVVETDKKGVQHLVPNKHRSDAIFKNGEAIKNAGKQARASLLLLAQV
ncbi:hypothetical protein ACGLWX_09590 [Halomonas sp. HMF6819]|uniref:hypothetical protein n=1 Tax=Halomonas sp. HMF6819 TaxID=3373085 RepID=UPI00378B27CB